MAGQPTLLTEETVAKARGYLDTCKDSYRRFDEMAENENQEEMCETEDCDGDCGKVHDDDIERPTRPRGKRYLFASRTRLHVELPSVAGLAIFLEVSRQTIYNWKDEETDLGHQFFDIVEKVLAEQERRLTSKGISGEYNGTIAKLLLTKHGYTDKVDVTSADKQLQATPEAQAAAAAALGAFMQAAPKPNGTTDTEKDTDTSRPLGV